MLPSSSPFSRRGFLRGAGACLALPWLESFATGGASAAPPHRMIAISTDLSMIPDYFFPKGAGSDYETSPYLQELGDREKFTVFSGVSHPEVTGGHQSDKCFLTGAPHPRKPGFRNSISIDQYAADRLGPVTRFPTLSLRVGPGGGSLSFTADGVRIPAEDKPSQVFRRLFLQGSPAEVERQIAQLRDGRSLMDSFAGRIRSLEKRAGGADRERLDQYFTSFRELERRMELSEEWEKQPKPEVDVPAPEDILTPEALVARTRNMYDLSRLAIETDSTRLITIFVTQQFNPRVDLPGVELPHHALTHQQTQPESREQLRTVEAAQMAEVGRLIAGLDGVKDKGASLLDRTMVLYGSNMGDAARHDTTNLPVVLAGGGFRHGQHLVFDQKHNRPLADLYVSMLQRLGVETDRFSSGTTTLPGLELV